MLAVAIAVAPTTASAFLRGAFRGSRSSPVRNRLLLGRGSLSGSRPDRATCGKNQKNRRESGAKKFRIMLNHFAYLTPNVFKSSEELSPNPIADLATSTSSEMICPRQDLAEVNKRNITLASAKFGARYNRFHA